MAFSSFVILAGMRTGSNFLEANLNSFEGISSLGELFNPHFVGGHNKDEMFGITLAQREADPFALLGAARNSSDCLTGFRLFHDHDPRVLEYVLNDRNCAKIILTRAPLESYVSLKIASETDQWRLADLRKRKEARILFDLAEFREHLKTNADYLEFVKRKLKHSGQTAFQLTYEDVGDVDVLNGLARFLGIDEEAKTVSNKTKKQNPSELSEKVSNHSEMLAQLSSLDPFGLEAVQDFEAVRGPAVPNYVAAKQTPILFLPIASGFELDVERWMASLDGVDVNKLERGFSQKSLRQWKKEHPGHRSFTIIRHPLRRAYSSFWSLVVDPEQAELADIRRVLAKRYDVKAPEISDISAIRESFKQFLKFLKGNLAGQTSLKTDAAWATQSAILEGFCAVQAPDLVIRDHDLERDLTRLAEDLGAGASSPGPISETIPITLSDIYEPELEKLCFQIYRKDYLNFGFSRGRPDQAA